MLKEAIEKIQSLCKPEIIEKDGATFAIGTDGEAKEILAELFKPTTITLNSLDALVKLVKTEAIPAEYPKPLYITIPKHNQLLCFTQPIKNQRYTRVNHYEVQATDVPGWNDKVQLPFEEAMIALRTRFQPTPDTEYALKLLSDITTGSKITYNDNGIATSVVTKRGIDLQANAAIRPIVKLKPYRTFQEVAQPESQFLIRINERGISFTEADGGMWKLDARNTIKAYLEAALDKEIANGTVVVAL